MDDVWGADLVEMQEWSKTNKGFRYMLNVIDVFSKYVWSIPLKDKKGDTVTEAFKLLVNNPMQFPLISGLIKVKNFITRIWMSG